MKLKRSTCAVALIAGLAGAAPAVLIPGPALAYVFTQVRIEGNQRIEPETILSYANVVRGAETSAGEVNDALQRLQNSGLFETVQVTPQGNTLVISVREWPTINQVAFEGNRRIDDEQLAEIAQSESRRVYSPSLAERDASNIAQAYSQQGRIAARVNPRIIPRDGNRVDLVFEVREGDVTEIERVGFTGNRSFSDRRLRNVLATKQAGLLRNFIQSDTYNPERLRLDENLLTDFYRSQGFADFTVQGVAPELTRERDAYYVTYAINEGPRYRFGQITTVSEIPGVDAAPFQQQNRVRSGTYYTPEIVDLSIRRMETIALQQGLDFVNIEPRITRNMRNQTLDLTFALTRGPRVFVERIDIEGNTTTLDEVIRRQFQTVEGDPFNPREIRNSAERIRALGYFADAQVDTREGSSPQQVIVDVNVEEQPTGTLEFGASYGASSGVGVSAGLSERNFLGRGQEVSVQISTASGSRAGAFTFVEPYFLTRDLRFSFSGWYRETDRDNADFNTRSVGLQTGIEFPISASSRLGVHYKYSKDTLFDVTPLGVDEDGDPEGSSPILTEEEGGLYTSAVGYSYSYDSRRVGLNPRTATKLSFTQDFAGLGGDVKSVTSILTAGVESTAWRPNITLRAEFEAGAVHMLDDQNSRVLDRFRGQRVRGFETNGIGPRDIEAPNEDALGGNYYWVARAEAQFPVGLPEEYGLTGGVFADVGSIWGLDNTAGAYGTTVDDDMNIRAAVGVSIFWTTPIGPLRMNVSKAVQKEDYDEEQNFDLTISTRF
ncbi:outer membrane protein assembly factor BamA [Paracoccus aerodenitrificans]|uniref:outer membrane protein assembly factor BamA n=1 Tax=Paracoccus aerodenitrificans TaxID=3017781 RepID=UPI0022F0DD60|nr:outer membrane protein assembly factor BamA [Paracoccus aerodenitrificans]WBU62660.1 outer membrane protein assembly factor BamA [Paracoccus aerodenitrificans]